ncbi:MAG TPA: FtsQ-type POTRA domain-containing protein [Pyrinomonadaceae bacterium]|jgi:cell division septal protein FtsQ|nr:FtsQ-type POTRA domain-containing protein [Pyrinomonadaceae bacterium]
MATRTRKTTLKSKPAATAPKRRRAAKPATRRTAKSGGNFANFFVPLFLIFCILFCLGFLGFMGYRTVTASEFFDVKKIDVRGTLHASKSDIEKIVVANTEKSGVWNADLKEIKDKVERLDFVKTAAVSRVLPDGVRVNVVERVPKAVVRLSGADYWADDEGVVLAQVDKTEDRPPFALRGWDESKTDKAVKENQLRVKMYQKMLEDWKTFDLAKRVKEVNLTDLDKPKAIIEDSGMNVFISLGKDDFGKSLQKGIEFIASKGATYEGIELVGQNTRLVPRQSN